MTDQQFMYLNELILTELSTPRETLILLKDCDGVTPAWEARRKCLRTGRIYAAWVSIPGVVSNTELADIAEHIVNSLQESLSHLERKHKLFPASLTKALDFA